MAQPPAYPPPAGAYPQGQPAAYPQGQPAAYPQGQPVAYPQGQPVAYPQGQPGVVYPPGQQVIVTQGNATHVIHSGGTNQGCCDGSNIAEHYNASAGLGTGVVHLVVGVLSIILGAASYAFPLLQVGYGIWSAIIFYIPTGILGIASKNKNACVVVAYMVMAILTTFHAIGMLAYEAFVASVLTYISSCYYQYTGFGSFYTCDYSRSTGAVAVHAILALLGFIEFINAIVCAVYCCMGHSCCCAPPPTNQGTAATTTVQYNQAQPQPQPMTVVSNKYAPGPQN